MGSALFALTLPLLAPLTVLVDLASPRRMARSRTLLVVGAFLLAELWGVSALTWAWLRAGSDEARLVARTHRIQHRWTSFLLMALNGAFGLRYEVEGAEALAPGGFLLMLNHTSTADTLLPMDRVVVPFGYKARFVLKEELTWDPCLDIAGHRLRNHFTRRGRGQEEAEAVGALAEGLGGDEVVVIFPEGTRFTPSRRARRLARLKQAGDPALAAAAEALTHTLLPKTGGATALMQRAPEADVVLAAHAGFGGVKSIASLLNGALVDQVIRVRFERYPADTLPRDPAAQAAWLVARWAEVDAWVATRA